MDLTHRFTVPLDVEETWSHFNDIGSLAECFPGATVTEFDGDSFSGSCKVKLGPIALVYNGSGKFVEKDEAAHRFVVDAKGKDKRGNGTAGAHVTLSMEETDGSTEVTVVTDLAITGKPAQFGRGVMQDVSDKLLGQFVACLETRLAGAHTEPSGESGPARPGHAVSGGPRAGRCHAGRGAGSSGPCARARPRAGRWRRPRHGVSGRARRTRATRSTSAPPCCRCCSSPTGSRPRGRRGGGPDHLVAPRG